MKSKKRFLNLIIILVEPQGPINVGSIARLCANFNVDELRIVSPKCDIFSIEAKKMALKGINYLNNSNIYKTLFDAINDCDLVLASSGRLDNAEEPIQDSLESVNKWIENFQPINKIAFVFGREDRGLTNKELLLSQKVFKIDTNETYPSLNLSHAVSIVLHELMKLSHNKNNKNLKPFDLARPTQIEICFLEIDKLLKRVGYLLSHTSDPKISKFKKYIIRARTSKNELNIIRGIVRQINWALNNLTREQ